MSDTTGPVTMTPEEFEAAIKQAEERGKNSAWAEARRTFEAKKRSNVDALNERVAKVETLLTEALAILIPGLGAPAMAPQENNE